MNRLLKIRAFKANGLAKAGGWMAAGVLGIFVLLALSCTPSNDFPVTPVLDFKGLYPATVKAGSSKDSIHISFHFTDGDGDIPGGRQSNNPHIFLIDSRESSPGKHDTARYNFPDDFDPTMFDPKYGLEGNFTLTVQAAFYLLDTLHPQGQSMHFQAYIVDDANHASNIVNTSELYLTP